VTRDAPLFTVFEVSNASRIENGPGIADDTFSFDLDIANPNGGPRWVTSSTLASPTTGTYGTNTLTVPAPLTAGTLSLDITDVSYPTNTQQIELEIPLRYQIAQSDLSGTLVDVSTNLDEDQSTRWVNDLTLNTVTFDSNGSNADSVISSEVLDLSDSGEVFFSGILTANETSTSSNFETIDRFKAELIYNLDGEPTTINLISPFDTGDGTSALTGVNGPPDGFLNGYNGNIGTDALNGTVYASGAENYNANLERDEFNLNGLPVDGQITAAFNLFATIPADADDATLVITAQRISGSEEITLSDLLFSSTPSNPDLDNDGIPNSYEIANGLNPNDPADAFTDLDGDGRSNLSEFIAATDPNDPSLFLGITSYSLNGNLVQLSWSSIPGITYGIQTSSDLNNWTDLGRVIPANASPATVTSTADINLNGLGTPAKTFFRVFVIE